MLEFRELKITKDSKHLYVDFAVKNGTWYNNVYVGGIMIDKAENFVNGGPSSHAIDISLNSNINEKRHFFDVSPQDIGETSFDGMYFVYAYSKGTPSMDVPCGRDNNIIMLAVYNTYPMYQMLMTEIRDISGTCCIPKDFIDSYLRLRAMETALETGHYRDALWYFNKFAYKGTNNKLLKKGGCGCGK